ncbi:UNVERIFIED_CONTAM: hypothetical protein GTU68_038803 [Idotea baltica]|nr:hypothetical protein [Idotea baltica]
MMAFTIGDDWKMDQRLVEVDLRGSMAHVNGLLRAELVSAEDHAALRKGLDELLASWKRGEWNVEPGDEDVHSAVERRLTAMLGDAGERLHTGRSRNDQVALDMRLWLRGAIEAAQAAADLASGAAEKLKRDHGDLPLPGYTHLRRGMPSSVADWIGAHRLALTSSRHEFAACLERIAFCPLGSGAGYGVPLPLDREGVAQELGFRGAETPVTAAQLFRGRAELAYLNALESFALDIEKLSFDLWLYSSEEFGFRPTCHGVATGLVRCCRTTEPRLVELLLGQCAVPHGFGRVARGDRRLRRLSPGLPADHRRFRGRRTDGRGLRMTGATL